MAGLHSNYTTERDGFRRVEVISGVARRRHCAHSGDCDRPFQPKVITDSGDRDHVLTRPTEAA